MNTPWTYKNKKGQFLSDKTQWTADYGGAFSSTTSLPIMRGKETIALCVSVDSCWEDTTAEDNAALIVSAVNNYDALLEALIVAERHLALIKETKRPTKACAEAAEFARRAIKQAGGK